MAKKKGESKMGMENMRPKAIDLFCGCGSLTNVE